MDIPVVVPLLRVVTRSSGELVALTNTSGSTSCSIITGAIMVLVVGVPGGMYSHLLGLLKGTRLHVVREFHREVLTKG